MSTEIIDGIDWVSYMAEFATDAQDYELFREGDPYDAKWVSNQCRKAALLCINSYPVCRVRLRKGHLSERDFAQVCCDMVLRLARQRQYKSESNGSYSYTVADAQSVPPGYAPTPRLFISKDDKVILTGSLNATGGASALSLGFDKGFGGW